jgi:hypothetical protein
MSKRKYIRLTTSPEDYDLIHAIVERAVSLANRRGMSPSADILEIALIACHMNGCPLNLESLLASPDEDLMKDVWGIQRNINIQTGRIVGDFVPQCAAEA